MRRAGGGSGGERAIGPTCASPASPCAPFPPSSAPWHPRCECKEARGGACGCVWPAAARVRPGRAAQGRRRGRTGAMCASRHRPSPLSQVRTLSLLASLAAFLASALAACFLMAGAIVLVWGLEVGGERRGGKGGGRGGKCPALAAQLTRTCSGVDHVLRSFLFLLFLAAIAARPPWVGASGVWLVVAGCA